MSMSEQRYSNTSIAGQVSNGSTNLCMKPTTRCWFWSGP